MNGNEPSRVFLFPFKGVVLIAPFYANIDCVTVWFRSSNDTVILTKIQEDVRVSFPHIKSSFQAEYAVIATWVFKPTGNQNTSLVSAYCMHDHEYNII